MSDHTDMLVDAIRALQDAQGNPVATYSGTDIPVLAGDAGAGKTLGIGGFGTDADLILVIVLEDMPGGFIEPTPKKTITSEGKVYRIDRTTKPNGDAFIVLALTDPTKGV